MGQVQGKVALITGAARGQGAAEARLFVAEGASVVLTDLRDDEGEALAAELGDRAVYRHHDVTSEDEWVAVVAGAVEAHGRLDILVNNAGSLVARKRLEELSLDFWQEVFDLNFTSMMNSEEYVTRVVAT